MGGLTVLREIREVLPKVPIRYVGDSAWCPYGTKSAGAIQERVLKISDHLIEQGATALVIACNSATIHAVETLRNTFPIPIIGMEPGVKPAAKLTKTGIVGILATEASIAGEKFHRLVNDHASGITVITKPCPRFVELVEAGILSGDEVREAVHEITDPLIESRADVLVLGCTHYPFLRAAIDEAIPPHVQVVDTGPAVARRVKEVLAGQVFQSEPDIFIESTGDPSFLTASLPTLLPQFHCKISRFEH